MAASVGVGFTAAESAVAGIGLAAVTSAPSVAGLDGGRDDGSGLGFMEQPDVADVPVESSDDDSDGDDDGADNRCVTM